jgi:hypothetical protein
MAALSAAWRPAQRSAIAARDSAELYETPAVATRALIRTGELDQHARSTIWEPCAGRGAIVREIAAAGFRTVASDLIAYDGADSGIETPVDFMLERTAPAGAGAIVTNPRFRLADDFVRHGIALGLPVIVLLRLQALEGAGRSDLIDRHLRRVLVGIERLPMMHRQDWTGPRTKNGGAPFSWFCFAPGVRNGPVELGRISWRAP